MKTNNIKFILCLIIFFLFTHQAWAGELYVCVDKNGNETISSLPQDKMKCSLKDTFRDPTPEELAEKEAVKKQMAIEEKDKIKSNEVILYTTSWCPYCKKAREYFNSRNIRFTDYDIEKDKEAADRKKQLDTRSGVPFAIINGRKIHGFSPANYEKALQQNP
ncbi:MAG: glutaredoxin family protein [Smithella sp.]|jgi:glutaredoxin